MQRSKKARLIELVILAMLVAGAGLVVWHVGHPEDNGGSSGSGKNSSAGNSSAPGTPVVDKTQYSVNDPASLWVIVNKGRILPSNYAPADLTTPQVPLRLGAGAPEMKIRAAAALAMQQMFADASAQNINLMLTSGYRSYSEQAALFSGYVAKGGQAAAEASSAHAGHSEHQSGWAADVEPVSHNCELDPCFGDTPEGKWLVANAYRFGFIIRYQKGRESLTGYEYEPWHLRYVGTSLAAQIYASGQTLEQFFGLPAFSDYPASSYALAPGS